MKCKTNVWQIWTEPTEPKTITVGAKRELLHGIPYEMDYSNTDAMLDELESQIDDAIANARRQGLTDVAATLRTARAELIRKTFSVA